jgi:UDP-N-acetylglucosamine 2-epimerase (non-hydrolysing)
LTKLAPRTCAFVLGTRPEAIKLAPVLLAMRARPAQFRPLLWVTGQHRELLDQVLRVFGLAPDADFALMQENQSQASLVGRILQSLDPLLAEHKPDWLLVQGDTSSALAGALAGFYAGVPVAHVEAGLRTYDLAAPFPEEGNRQLISRIARLHCAPTELAMRQLRAEQIPAGDIVQTGNTVVDAIRWVAARHSALPAWPAGFAPDGCRLVLTTLHRRESFGATLQGMLRAIRALAEDAALKLAFVFPVHPNPNVRQLVHEILGGCPRIALLPPLGYTELATVLAQSWLVLTDSGGLQEEGPSLHKPVLVLRDVTERPEGVETGAAELAGTDPVRLAAAVRRLAADPAAYARMAQARNPYGDGAAAGAILDALLSNSPQ